MTSEMKQQMMEAETFLKRSDLATIADMIPTHAKILDLGCGNGELLKALKLSRQAKVMGVEMDQEKPHF